MVTSRVCIGENLTSDPDTGALQMAKWSVPRLVHDQVVLSTGDGTVIESTTSPGTMLMDHATQWVNDSPVGHTMLIRVIRRWKKVVTSNPNAIQFRDRWSWQINAPAVEPITSGILNGQAGLAGDLGTDTVAEPLPGVFTAWLGSNMSDEWVGLTLNPGDQFNIRYRMYVWTPPPWSDNANKNAPEHSAEAGFSRLQLIAFPQQGPTVQGGPANG
jgi:hypothetical protein